MDRKDIQRPVAPHALRGDKAAMNAPNRTPFQQALEAAQAGDFPRAEAIAHALFARDANDVSALQIAGFVAFRQGRNTDALKAFIKASAAMPDHPPILYWLGVLFKERADFVQAERAFARLVHLDPRHAEAWCQLGETLFPLDRKEEAQRAFETAMAAGPQSSIVFARAARYFEVTHDLAKARTLAEKALRLDPENEIAAIAIVEIDMRDRRYDDVVARAVPLLDRVTGNLRNRARLHHLIATARDKRSEYGEAFANYDAANRLQRQLDGGRATETSSPLHPHHLDRMIRYVSETDIAAWAPPPSEGAALVFLMGFPRSGTTWLDQILSSHPDIAVMEEEDNFAGAWRDLTLTESGLARLNALSTEEISSYREAYWTRARKALKDNATRPVTVDKMPLNTAQLPLIWRLFPESKIIFALRDPRDAVFSGFQQHFQINTGMSYFLDIKSAAEFYDRVLTIGMRAREKARFDLYEIRYERLAVDFETEARKLIAFLGLPWSDAVLDYQETAKKRAIKTPSARQVVEKPYATSIGKWRRYHEGMAPALPILAPWVARFGYEES